MPTVSQSYENMNEREYVITCLKRRPMSDLDLKHSHLNPQRVDIVCNELEKDSLIEKTSEGWKIIHQN